MNAKEKQSSTRKIGRGLSPIAHGRYSKDYNRTTEQMAYHCDIRDLSNDPDTKAREQHIIDNLSKHLGHLEEKLGY